MPNEDWSDRELDPGARAVDRELDRLRRVYRDHADTLSALAGTAPTKALARKYSELIGEINRSILALDDPGAIVPRTTGEPPARPAPSQAVPPQPTPSQAAPPQRKPLGSAADLRLRTEPGLPAPSAGSEDGALGRIAVILFLAIVVIAVLAFFVWKFGGERQPSTPRAAEPGIEAPVEPEPEAPLRATPEAQDFGVVYKGTRVARRFEVMNNTDRDVTVEIERSRCRCLWFDYPRTIPARGRIAVSVTVDGARTESGLLSEAVVIATKDQPRVATEVQITAEIR